MFSVRDIKNISHAKPTDTALKPCDIHFHYQNVRGLRTKLTEFRLNTLDAKYQIIILTETWLDNSIPSSLLFDPGYSVYRCDRSLSNSMHTRGGGALIACSFLLNTRELTLPSNSLEQVWVTVRLSSCTIFIGTVYIPPNRANDTNTLTSVIESVSAIVNHAKTNDLIFLFRNFNFSAVSWSPSQQTFGHSSSFAHYVANSSSSVRSRFLDEINASDLNQKSGIKNSLNRQLDLVFANFIATSYCIDLHPCPTPLISPDLYHPVIDLTVRIPSTMPNPTLTQASRSRMNFYKTNFTRLDELITNYNSQFRISQFNSVDEDLSIFIRFLLSSFDSCVPIITPMSGPAWSDPHLKKLKRAKAAELKKYTKNRSNVNKCILNETTRLYRSYNKIRYGGYLSRLEKNFIKRPKALWSCRKKRNNTNVYLNRFTTMTELVQLLQIFVTYLRVDSRKHTQSQLLTKILSPTL
uniref:uncharacterized protein LOC120959073 n=1 Tax=Anopheles coluzzii TaxID=1518534 RepID=UPI0020FF8F74|nr:uncharacterized protein LOC120959073 [Anopheles coluzzii]XP_049466031.1 uncharacterized protein LOC120959073 [Anopheles coluzzii]XP_049466032.1 uncharacterized protein LOC120959073 [Anopheles coluzzii]